MFNRIESDDNIWPQNQSELHETLLNKKHAYT